MFQPWCLNECLCVTICKTNISSLTVKKLYRLVFIVFCIETHHINFYSLFMLRWFRNDFDDGDDPSSFEADLAMLCEMEAEMREAESQESTGVYSDWETGKRGCMFLSRECRVSYRDPPTCHLDGQNLNVCFWTGSFFMWTDPPNWSGGCFWFLSLHPKSVERNCFANISSICSFYRASWLTTIP